MPISDFPSDDVVCRFPAKNIHGQINQPQSPKNRERDKAANPRNILGVIAFIYTGQVTVVVAMNAPLLAIISKDFFAK